jgi:hypothetical protein
MMKDCHWRKIQTKNAQMLGEAIAGHTVLPQK